MRIARDLTNPAWGSQGLIKDRLNSGSVLQVRSWHSHGAHLGGFSFCISFHGESWKGRFLMEKSRGITAYFTRYTPYSIVYLFEQMRRGQRKKGAISNTG
jgi:hypothetical protein